jgi:hypothetical protein
MPGVELDGLCVRAAAKGEGESLLIIDGRLTPSTRGLLAAKDLATRHRGAAVPNRVAGESAHGEYVRRVIRGLLRE